jgi:LmbE family N-acetylglucosaminyl deacetylase
MRDPMSDQERHTLIEELERVLVVFSHPDDAEFLAAAAVATLVDGGARVDYLVTTDGGKGTEDPGVAPEQLAATRIDEQRAAADVLGVQEIIHLAYPDGYLTPSLDLRRDIVRQIRRLRPDLVITMNPQRRLDGGVSGIAHPDHLATGEATMAAVYPAARDRLNFPELAEEGLEPWKVRQLLVMSVERPNLWIDVTESFDRGFEALLCHASQIDDPDEERDWMRERAEEVGRTAGMPMAQAFLSILMD